MKKIIIIAVVVFGMSLVSSCESTNVNDETGIEIQDTFETDKGDSINPGGGGNDPGDNDEE